jgi:hypothetical protein
MPMHFLGGLWLGLIFLWFLKPNNLSWKVITKIVLLVLIISLTWEGFEVLLNRATMQDPFSLLDTISDICFDLGGAFVSVIYFAERIILKENFKV